MNDIQIILQSSSLVSGLGTATVISMALSTFLYNGYFNKVWRALAVIAGFAASVLILISGLDKAGIVDLSITTIVLGLAFIASAIGFYLGVFIYRREEKRSDKKHGMTCHLDVPALTNKEKHC